MNNQLIRKIGFWLLWAGFLGYAFFLAPPNQPDTFELIKNMSLGNLAGINPAIVALFYLMGVFPAIYACLLLIDGRGQKISAWLFVLLSFGVGAFAILPYLALREINPEFPGNKDWLIKLQDSRWYGIFLAIATISLLAFGILKGDWTDFVQQWQTSRFIHIMSLDFCLLCLLFPALVGDDIQRRETENSLLLRIVAIVPLLGAVAYLCLRPNLSENKSEEVPSSQVSLTN
ncbi:DUF2834 domain-containing protein [Oscillatoria salina]|uniref:DUF2834 domain-containing protein n=1 Tax=Oscillatoria salina TaxID=331517 RepID=UPI0013B9786D|nr:DUF2834 domain-containing protein [Oscillatoria salina]MBZ8180470.1 DUF2834 domain-containing protein [Oscillatoria salina IIICB1]NET87995.1 DUF2834 domain-containing protein [Kamptonema sp. SIO1D9]